MRIALPQKKITKQSNEDVEFLINNPLINNKLFIRQESNIAYNLSYWIIDLMRDYINCPKLTTKPRLPDIFSNFRCLRVVFTWVFFSSLLPWELFLDKI